MSVVTLTAANFKQIIEQNAFVIVDFWAQWCEPCMQFSDVYAKLSSQMPDIVFGMLNTDDYPEIAAYFQVKQVPFVLAIRDKIIIDGQVGAMSQVQFSQRIDVWRSFDHSEIVRHFDHKIAV